MRQIQLDVLRAVAVFMVLFRHLGLGKDNHGLVGVVDHLQSVPYDAHHIPEVALQCLFRCGWAGVDLFFVLSGFLVSGLLFREYLQYGNLHLGRFLFRRGLKIYPSFYAFLATTAIAMGIAGANKSAGAWWCEALFVQNYGPNIWGHTWSLAVEEHFYLLLGLLLWRLAERGGSNPFRTLPAIFVGVAAAVSSARLLTALANPMIEHKTHYFPTHLRVDALFFGVLLSYYHHFEPHKIGFVKRSPGLVLLVSALLVSPTLILNQNDILMFMGGLPALYLGCGGLLLTALASEAFTKAPFCYLTRPLAVVGVHSYSIYLWHAVVLVIGIPLCVRLLGEQATGWPSELLLYGCGSIAVGVAMARAVELPILKLRDRYFPTRNATAKAIAATDTLETSVA